MAAGARQLGDARVLLQQVDDADSKALRTLIDQLRIELKPAVILLASEKDGKASLIAAVDESLHDRVKAGDLLKQVAGVLGGRGGGRADLAQGGAPSLAKLDTAFASTGTWLEEQLVTG